MFLVQNIMGIMNCRTRLLRTGIQRISSLHGQLYASHAVNAKKSEITTAPEATATAGLQETPRSFLDEQTFRREQAHRSVLVQVPAASFAGTLQQQCREFAQVECMFHFQQKDKDYILTELNSLEAVASLLQISCHQRRDDIIPVRTRLIEAASLRNPKFIATDKLAQHVYPSQDDVDNKLRTMPDISLQMEAMHQMIKLPELGTRLRYFISSQIEEAISGIFPSNRVYLFGSSTNGFGHHTSDVDMILDFDVGHSEKQQTPADYDFRFACKAAAGNERIQTQRSLEFLADHIQHLIPGYSGVQRILMARVPIVKFNHDASGIQCDLSITNMSGLVMTDYLYTLGQVDPRLRALVVTIRRWAKANHLTNPSPGRWITNFTLTILAVFFMQQRKLLPPLSQLRRNFTQKDTKSGQHDLRTLLVEFFHFYTSFDYKRNAISVIEGVEYSKPDFSPLYIENPVETDLNICRNLSAEELDRVINAMRSASWLLESDVGNESKMPGILKLFTEPTKTSGIAQAPITRVEEYFADTSSSAPSSPANKYRPDEFVVETLSSPPIQDQRRRPSSQLIGSVQNSAKRNLQPNVKSSGYKPRW